MGQRGCRWPGCSGPLVIDMPTESRRWSSLPERIPIDPRTGGREGTSNAVVFDVSRETGPEGTTIPCHSEYGDTKQNEKGAATHGPPPTGSIRNLGGQPSDKPAPLGLHECTLDLRPRMHPCSEKSNAYLDVSRATSCSHPQSHRSVISMASAGQATTARCWRPRTDHWDIEVGGTSARRHRMNLG